MAIRRRTIMRGSMRPSGDAILLLRAKSLLPRLHGIAILWPANADAAMKTANIAKNRAAFAPRLHQERNFCKRGEVLGGLLSQRYLHWQFGEDHLHPQGRYNPVESGNGGYGTAMLHFGDVCLIGPDTLGQLGLREPGFLPGFP